MKEFRPTFLYVKTHNETGLKYFGKTTKDPYRYRGSGKYWIRHLIVHGNDVTTEVIGYFTNADECRIAAKDFSIRNRIKESSQWANIQDETGLDGGDTAKFRKYSPLSDTTKAKISASKHGKIPWNKGKKTGKGGNTKPRSPETIQKLQSSMRGLKQSQETKEKRAASLKAHWSKRRETDAQPA